MIKNRFVVSSALDNYIIYAFYGEKKIGRLDIKRYDYKPLEVSLVWVNNAAFDTTGLRTYLHKIYDPLNISLNIKTQKWKFTTELDDNALKSGDHKLLSHYSEDMKTLKDAFFDKYKDASQDHPYLFFINGFEDASLQGFMPISRAIGFVSAQAQKPFHTVAHELMHGAFGVEHTFPTYTENSTQNLMDYGGGEELIAEQWQQVLDPNFKLNWFQKEEDGANKINDEKLFAFLQNIGAYTFAYCKKCDNVDSKVRVDAQSNLSTYNLLVADQYFKCIFGELDDSSPGVIDVNLSITPILVDNNWTITEGQSIIGTIT